MNGFLTFFLLVPVLFAAQTHAAESTKVGLAEAKKFAVEHNFEVMASRNGLEEARARLGRARSAYYPRFGVAGGADTMMTAAGNQPSAVAYLYGDMNLFNGFGDFSRTTVAALEVEKAEIRLKRAEFNVGLEVERAFHAYLFKKLQIVVKKEAIRVNEAHRGMVGLRRRSGMASESDAAEFDIKGSVLESDLLLLEQDQEEERTHLKRLLGEEVGSSMEPVGELQHQHLKGSLNDLAKRIKSESESVQVSSRDVAIAAAESKVARARWMPRLDAEIYAGYLPWDLRQVGPGAAMVGGKLVAKIDLFSGFDTLNERREAEAKRLRAEAGLKQSILTSLSEMENAYRRIITVQKRVDLEERNEERSARYYKAVMSEYRRGIKNSADLRVAADMLSEATLRHQQYKFEFLNGRLDLEKALGGPVETEVIPDHHSHGE